MVLGYGRPRSVFSDIEELARSPFEYGAIVLLYGAIAIIWRNRLINGANFLVRGNGMPRGTQAQLRAQLESIAEIIGRHTAGISRGELSTALLNEVGKRIADRTLQRRLEALVARGDIVADGAGPSTIYKPPVMEETRLPALDSAGRGSVTIRGIGAARLPDLSAQGEKASTASHGYPPLSAASRKIRALVRRPISRRPPVGYDRELLFAYEPGITWYLPPKLRAHLAEIGKSPDPNRPAGTFARDVLGRLLIDLAWASSRLEGNTYTRLDTQNLLEFGQRAAGKDAQEAQMILNHKAAIELLVSGAEYVGFNRLTLLSVHTALSENLLADPADEGRLRERPVSITGSSFTPIAIPQVIVECLDRIVEAASRIPDPLEQAFFAMVHIPYLQPFADVNKRTSRLAANIPLIAANFCPLSFVDVPENAYVEGTLAVYEQRRVELLRDVFAFAYERSCAQYRVVRESLGEPDPVRLRYRTQLADVVAQTVRANEPPNPQQLRQRGQKLGVPAEDLVAFSEAGLRILLGLHEGSAGRYGLSPNQFNSWRAQFRQPT